MRFEGERRAVLDDDVREPSQRAAGLRPQDPDSQAGHQAVRHGTHELRERRSGDAHVERLVGGRCAVSKVELTAEVREGFRGSDGHRNEQRPQEPEGRDDAHALGLARLASERVDRLLGERLFEGALNLGEV